MAKALKPAASESAQKRDPLIITRSELEQLSETEQQAFRKKNGTVVEDHALPSAPEAPAQTDPADAAE